MKKRILFIAENLYGGGVERILQIVLKNFDYEKYDVTLYSSRPETLHPDYYPTSIRLQHYFESCGANASLYKKIRCRIINKLKLLVYYHLSPTWFYRLFIKGKYDVGIAFIEGYATRILSGGPKNMKKIAWVHIELNTYHWTEVAFQSLKEERKCYAQMDNVVCVSNIVKEQVDNIFNTNGKSNVIHNPIDVKYIIESSQLYIPNQYAKKNKVRIVTIGSLTKRKGIDRLVKASAVLQKQGFDFDVLILGKGPCEKDIYELITELGLEKDVKLVGFQSNPYPFLKSADIYVCSSFAEGYNTAVSEALILGKAVVSTEVSGVREQLGDNSEYGIIVENTTDGLCKGIATMLHGNNIQHYTELSKKRGSLFSLERQMLNIYNLIEA